MYVVIRRGDVVARYLHHIRPGRRDYLCAVVLVIGGVTGGHRVGRGRKPLSRHEGGIGSQDNL